MNGPYSGERTQSGLRSGGVLSRVSFPAGHTGEATGRRGPDVEWTGVDMGTHSAGHRDLVPLEPGFDKTWLGWRPDQVTEYLDRVEADVQTLVADRDAALAHVDELVQRLDESRNEAARLRAELDKVSREPVDATALDPLLRRKVELAEHSAEHIVGRARMDAEEKQRTADQLLATYRNLLADAQRQRSETETTGRELVHRARSEAEALTAEADEQRRTADIQAQDERHRADEQAEQRRARIEEEFSAWLQHRRIDDDERHARRLADSKHEAGQVLHDAVAEADRVVGHANDQADAVRHTRSQIAERLREVHALLADGDQSWRLTDADPAPDSTHEPDSPQVTASGSLRWPERVPVDLTPPAEREDAPEHS
ncbi:hypothetical protein GIY23_03495 [Allosaccharopolyspora coralli]|uniref:Cellulose-binding protein n=1 Tax=Allosaccharopolyspora coralli TaxID=2665642 RepID=A0A5Q3QAV0_9PSEU|nr:DivIVA domain-containing protein [Allosaccharopolyspora coralli]QGK68739.1 hypothetical protein GIY23_03495 [Allosaccharopolyspora coralli]